MYIFICIPQLHTPYFYSPYIHIYLSRALWRSLPSGGLADDAELEELARVGTLQLLRDVGSSGSGFKVYCGVSVVRVQGCVILRVQ